MTKANAARIHRAVQGMGVGFAVRNHVPFKRERRRLRRARVYGSLVLRDVDELGRDSWTVVGGASVRVSA